MRIYSVELAIQELDDKRMLRLRQEVEAGKKGWENLGMRRCDMKVIELYVNIWLYNVI